MIVPISSPTYTAADEVVRETNSGAAAVAMVRDCDL